MFFFSLVGKAVSKEELQSVRHKMLQAAGCNPSDQASATKRRAALNCKKSIRRVPTCTTALYLSLPLEMLVPTLSPVYSDITRFETSRRHAFWHHFGEGQVCILQQGHLFLGHVNPNPTYPSSHPSVRGGEAGAHHFAILHQLCKALAIHLLRWTNRVDGFITSRGTKIVFKLLPVAATVRGKCEKAALDFQVSHCVPWTAVCLENVFQQPAALRQAQSWSSCTSRIDFDCGWGLGITLI